MKILMRMGKNPFNTLTAEEILRKNILGTNVGNSLFLFAAHKILTTKEQKVFHYRFTPRMQDVEWVNNNFDAYVIPLANAFRISYQKHLDKHTEFIRNLKIPVIVFGVGTQLDINGDNYKSLDPIKQSVISFCTEVLKRSKSIGVRGDITKKYLMHLGFNDKQITTIGCPSVFWHGSKLKLKQNKISKNSKIAFSVSPYAKNVDCFIDKISGEFQNTTYIGQTNDDLEKLLYDKSSYPLNIESGLKKHFENNKAYMPIEHKAWLNQLKKQELYIGTRIHGGIASLLSGVPAIIVTHDSRTQELAEYFNIPHIKLENIKSQSLTNIAKHVSYNKLLESLPEKLRNTQAFLKENNLENIFETKNQDILKEYDEKYNTMKLNKEQVIIKPLRFTSSNALCKRIKFLHNQLNP